jgi:hypothetical protein
MPTLAHVAMVITAAGLIILGLATFSIQAWARGNVISSEELLIRVGIDLTWSLFPLFIGFTLPVFVQDPSRQVSPLQLGATSLGVIAYLALYYTVIRPSLVKLRMQIRALRRK